MANHSPRTSAHTPDSQSLYDAGRKVAFSWFAQHGHTLCVFRDLQRAQHITSATPADVPQACRDFDNGFARGLADFIAGVNHG